MKDWERDNIIYQMLIVNLFGCHCKMVIVLVAKKKKFNILPKVDSPKYL